MSNMNNNLGYLRRNSSIVAVIWTCVPQTTSVKHKLHSTKKCLQKGGAVNLLALNIQVNWNWIMFSYTIQNQTNLSKPPTSPSSTSFTTTARHRMPCMTELLTWKSDDYFRCIQQDALVHMEVPLCYFWKHQSTVVTWTI